MEKLSYKTLKNMNYEGYLLEDAPEKVLQFGEGNFLRGFVDYFFDMANEKCGFNGKVVVVQPIAQGLAPMINAQDGLYTLYLRGSENGEKINRKRVISSISRCLNPYEDYRAVLDCASNPDLRYIVSNTTEAGIAYDPACQYEDAPASSFPGKLTQFLHHRFMAFDGDMKKGLVILSCELIDNNGQELKKCVEQYAKQWGLTQEFLNWLDGACLFCSTLVDRIVTGYPRNEAAALNEENGYEDNLLDTAEVFGFWVIEGPKWLEEELPFKKAQLPILVTEDHKPYKMRKVRILNGAHTSMVLGAFLAGQNIVRDCMHDDVIRGYMERILQTEVIPTLSLPKAELEEFAAAVKDRFQNPYIDHALLAISLNSTSKWKARVLPSVKGYVEKNGTLPPCLTMSLAFLIAFYHCERLEEDQMIGKRGDEEYPIKDDRFVLEFYAAHKDAAPEQLVHDVLTNEAMWGEDLTQLPGFEKAVCDDYKLIQEKGAYEAMKTLA